MIERQSNHAVAVDYLSDDAEYGDGWYGYQLGYDGEGDDSVDDSWDERADTDRWFLPPELAAQAAAGAAPVGEDASVETVDRTDADAEASDVSWERRLSGIDPWEFKVSSNHSGHRSKRLAICLGVAAVAAVLVAAVLTVTRSPQPASTESTVSPQPSSAAPAPSATAPGSTAAPIPPAAPPPPPPPVSAEQITTAPPVVRQQPDYQPRQQPSTQKKPQIDVTRAPISAKPPPPPASQRDSSAPGDAPKPRRRGFW